MSLSATTYVSRSSRQILRQLANLPHVASSSSSQTLLFSLAPAPDLSQDALSELVRVLTRHPNAVGCLSAPLLQLEYEGTTTNNPTICSVATFDEKTATPFRSTIPGKEPIQVGRWHAFRKRDEKTSLESLPQESEGINWESVWAKNRSAPDVPPELRGLRPEDVQTILYLSDSAPEGLAQSLSKFDRASKLGFIASSTPFVTGRPHTLFFGNEVHSAGAVGIAFTSDGSAKPRMDMEFPELNAITDRLLTVTDIEGNMVHTLDGANPSHLILSAIEKLNGKATPTHVDIGIQKDEFFLGVHRDGKLYQLYTIQGGDPARGTIALRSDAAPDIGSKVKIYRKSTDPGLRSHLCEGLNFITVPPEGTADSGGSGEDDDHVAVFQGTFLATSENGFIISRTRESVPCERSWNSTVTGGHATIHWND